MISKTPLGGNFFEDFKLGQKFAHGAPRTITEGDASLYIALTGSRFALNSAATVAREAGFNRIPLDNLLVFHIAFGKTVNDISLNAIANLGYAELKFCAPCYAGDTLEVCSQVIGTKANSNGLSGIVYVHSQAFNQNHELVVSWKRWVMVNCHQPLSERPEPELPSLNRVLGVKSLWIPDELTFNHWRDNVSDHQLTANQLKSGQWLDHRDGMTLNDSDHSLATRLYQNNAQVHFDAHKMRNSRHGQRLIYGGHVISVARALSYNGLGNAIWFAGINGGSHCNPCFAGDTLYAASQIMVVEELDTARNLSAVRLRTFAFKNAVMQELQPFYDEQDGRLKYHPQVVLDLDYWVFMPTQIASDA